MFLPTPEKHLWLETGFAFYEQNLIVTEQALCSRLLSGREHASYIFSNATHTSPGALDLLGHGALNLSPSYPKTWKGKKNDDFQRKASEELA